MRKPSKARNPVARQLRESGNYRAQVVKPRKGAGSYKRCEVKGRRPDARRDGASVSAARHGNSLPPRCDAA